MGRKNTTSTELITADPQLGEVLASHDLASGVVAHLGTRTRQYADLEHLDLFGTDEEAKRSREPRKGDHPVVQLLKYHARRFAESQEAKVQVSEKENLGIPEGLYKDISDKVLKPQAEARVISAMMELAGEASKRADAHFGNAIKLWMDWQNKATDPGLKKEDAIKVIMAKYGCDEHTARMILKQAEDTVDGE